ncbi:MAG: hypothetical protein HUU04_05940 [Verrucomicrobiae bacterium]|nr:hypothetical protein [Verrucomicrobiae bacterium]
MKLSAEKIRQLILVFLLVLGILGAVWHFLVRGLEVKRTRDEREKESLGAKIAEQKNAIQTEIHNREVAGAYRQFIARCEQQIPSEHVETWFVRKVSSVASHHGLQIVNTAIRPLREGSGVKFQNQPYRLEGFSFDVEGEFNQIGRFLEDLENSIPLVEVDEMGVAAGAGAARHIHKANIRLTMVVPADTR